MCNVFNNKKRHQNEVRCSGLFIDNFEQVSHIILETSKCLMGMTLKSNM